EAMGPGAESISPIISTAEPAPAVIDDSIEVEVREAPAPVATAAATAAAAAVSSAPLSSSPLQAAPQQSASSAPAPAPAPVEAHAAAAAAAAPVQLDTSAPPRRSGVWGRSSWGPVNWQPRRPTFPARWLSQPWQVAGVSLSPRLALALSGGFACLAVGTSATLWLGWNQASTDLRQERTIRLLEGIRDLGPAGSGTPTAAAGAANAPAAAKPDDGLPPPPPEEPWIEELGQLEGQRGGGGAAPLRVPVNGTLRAPAPVASAPASLPVPPPPPVPAATGAGTPELVGVVQVPGRAGSAIFQVGGSSTNASAGESIGSSGWRLVSTNGESAVIERAGVSRRVSISSGF
ncbi:MAG: hypothetical protein RLZZ219_1362, partial [Cyanobacteriota bacterium]